jgi:hypothetical protein
VSNSFTATKQGVPPVTNKSKHGNITIGPGVQAYVTFGAGLATQPLNDALDPLGLFTMGAGHGKRRQIQMLKSF